MALISSDCDATRIHGPNHLGMQEGTAEEEHVWVGSTHEVPPALSLCCTALLL